MAIGKKKKYPTGAKIGKPTKKEKRKVRAIKKIARKAVRIAKKRSKK